PARSPVPISDIVLRAARATLVLALLASFPVAGLTVDRLPPDTPPAFRWIVLLGAAVLAASAASSLVALMRGASRGLGALAVWLTASVGVATLAGAQAGFVAALGYGTLATVIGLPLFLVGCRTVGAQAATGLADSSYAAPE
ncbi:MAG: hypothetical protein ABJC19_11485, partial [Gemmatimonadota bacterium]